MRVPNGRGHRTGAGREDRGASQTRLAGEAVVSAAIAGPAAPKRWRFGRVAASPLDPPEPWEIPLPRRGPDEFDCRISTRPFRPTRWDEVPAPAPAALEEVCGRLPLERLFVVPRTTRLVANDRCVITPAEVLGFGAETVALWVADGPRGRVLSVPVGGLIAVDDRRVLLHGRLLLVTGARNLAVRYNTVARHALMESLRELRARMAREQSSVAPAFVWPAAAPARIASADLPYKWRMLLRDPTILPARDDPAIVAVGDVAGIRGGRGRAPSGMAILGSSELVVVSEPADVADLARYGIDLLAVPRERLVALAWDGRTLTVHGARDRATGDGAASISLAIDRRLVEAMQVAFGAAVRWI